MNSFGNRSVMRVVMVDNLTTEDGILLPKGSMVSVLAHPAQCDESLYENPLEFNPFRFSTLRESSTSSTSSQHSFVATGPNFLPFGHGRHSCPGRFLLDFELKMMLEYLVMNYDMSFPGRYEGRRPESRWVAEAIMPPGGADIRVRRRE